MTIEEIDGELWIDSGYGFKQVADLVGSIAYLYDGGVIQLTEEEMHELEHSDEELISVEAVAPLLIYKDFKQNMKGLDASAEEFWRIWLEFAKDNGLDNEDAMKVVDTFANQLVADHIHNRQSPSGKSMEHMLNFTGVDTLVDSITPDKLGGLSVDEIQEKWSQALRHIEFLKDSSDVKTDQAELRYQISRLESLSSIVEDAVYDQSLKDSQNPFDPSSKKGRTYPDFMGAYNLLESFATESVWRCSLCNMELEETDDVEKRKQRHEDFHKDESVGKSGARQRNWTFGEVDWTLEEPSTKTSLYESYNEEVAKELFFDLSDGVVTWEEITDEMKADVIKYVDDNKLYMSSPATEGGWGSGKKDHQQWMNPTERLDDKVESEDMNRNKFLTFQIEESTNPYLEEYNKAFELDRWDEEEKELDRFPQQEHPMDKYSPNENEYDYDTMKELEGLALIERDFQSGDFPYELDDERGRALGTDWQKGGESW